MLTMTRHSGPASRASFSSFRRPCGENDKLLSRFLPGCGSLEGAEISPHLAFEFRHASWNTPETLDLLTGHGCAMVIHDMTRSGGWQWREAGWWRGALSSAVKNCSPRCRSSTSGFTGRTESMPANTARPGWPPGGAGPHRHRPGHPGARVFQQYPGRGGRCRRAGARQTAFGPGHRAPAAPAPRRSRRARARGLRSLRRPDQGPAHLGGTKVVALRSCAARPPVRNPSRAVAAVTPALTEETTFTRALSKSSPKPAARAFSMRLRCRPRHPRVMVTASPTRCFSRSVNSVVPWAWCRYPTTSVSS